jgi:hypothetical protein
MTYKKFTSLLDKGVILIMVALVLSSCSYKRDILLKLDPSLRKNNIQVDLLGVNKRKLTELNNMSYATYWNMYDKRGIDKFELEIKFSAYDDLLLKAIVKGDNIWEIWGHDEIEYVFIAADTPLLQQQLKWKASFALTRFSMFNFWSNRTVYIYINKNGLELKE